MSNKFSALIRRKLLGKNQNLVSIEDPFEVMRRLLGPVAVTGILDAGASDGRISRRLLKRFPDARAYAFEPNPSYADALKAYARQDDRFRPQFLALSDAEGTATLHITDSAGNTSLFRPGVGFDKVDPQGARISREVPVKTVTIDNWAAQNGGTDIQVMKFDIQGAELRALRGGEAMLRRTVCLVYAEVWFHSIYEGGAVFSDIDQFLLACGFVLYDFYKPKYNDRGLIQWANTIFVHKQRLGF